MTSIKRIVKAKPFDSNTENRQIYRVIGSTDIKGKGTEHDIADIDPIIFLDEAEIQGEVPETFNKHPHMGLAAISYLLKGEFRAWDSINGDAEDLNRAGGVYYVDSGRGVVHGEAAAEGKRDARWLQLWINPGIHHKPLPPAHYQLFQPNELPVHEESGLWVKVVVGDAFGLSSSVESGCPLQYLHCKVAAQHSVTLALADANWQGFIYVLNGSGQFGDEAIQAEPQDCLELAVNPDSIRIQNPNKETLEFIMVSGKPHNYAFYKLLGHGGALVADNESDLHEAMSQFESLGHDFGR